MEDFTQAVGDLALPVSLNSEMYGFYSGRRQTGPILAALSGALVKLRIWAIVQEDSCHLFEAKLLTG